MKKKTLHEINRYEDAAFPVEMYTVTKESIFPKGRGYMDLHWHEELQFTMVLGGSLQMQVDGVGYAVNTGEAIFINRNHLHITTDLTAGGKYVSFNFPDRMLGFFSGSRMEQDDVLPFTGALSFPAMVLRPELPWQREMLDIMETMRKAFFEKRHADPGSRAHFEYWMALCITGLWYRLISHVDSDLREPSRSAVRKQERIKKMLSYIHENYMEPIKLDDIAASASVSVGECCRCFKEMVRKSPNQYLLAYRSSSPMELLGSSQKTLTEIAVETGFNDASHFIQYFKRQTGMTPKDYRKC